jgi:hypothetical protein
LLISYEKYWERGKHYFLNGKLCSQLIHFSSILECLSEKYSKFEELIEYRDTDIFVMIPMIMILKSCEGDDKKICEHFLAEITNCETKLGQMYAEVKSVLYESNGVFNKKQEEHATAQSRSIRIGRKIPVFEKRRETSDKFISENQFITENKKTLPSISNKDNNPFNNNVMPSINPIKNTKNNYKTLLTRTSK